MTRHTYEHKRMHLRSAYNKNNVEGWASKLARHLASQSTPGMSQPICSISCFLLSLQLLSLTRSMLFFPPFHTSAMPFIFIRSMEFRGRRQRVGELRSVFSKVQDLHINWSSPHLCWLAGWSFARSVLDCMKEDVVSWTESV